MQNSKLQFKIQKFSKKTTITFDFELLTFNFWRSQTGVSLIESLLVVSLVGIIVALLTNLPNAFGLISKSKHTSIAYEIAAKQIEDKRTINFANLVNDSSIVADPRMNLLPNSEGLIVIEDCPPTICTNGENIKQVNVTVNWQHNSKNQTVSLKTFIGEGGINQ